MAKDKGKGKEVKLPLEAKGSETTLKVKDVALKAKEADPKPKGADPKPTNLPVSQPGNRLTLLQPRHSLGFLFLLLMAMYIFFVCHFPLSWQFSMFKMYFFFY